MENVNGWVKVEVGDLCERKNGRGVDINWNWKVDWGKKEKDYNLNEEYLGIVLFSEFEIWILYQFVKEFVFQVWVNVYLGMEVLFMFYDYKKMVFNDSGGVVVRNLFQVFNE